MALCKKIEVKGGWYVKKLEFDQTKKNLIYQFFKTRICAFMTYGRFLPKSSLNSSFVIRDSRVRGCLTEASNPWLLDNKSQIWATFRQKSTIGHKSTYPSFKKMIYKIFFHLIEFQLFHISASFDLNFLKKDYLLLWPMVNFRPKATQNWDLWSEIQGFEAFEGAQPRLSNP